MKKKVMFLLKLAMPYVLIVFFPVISVLYWGATVLNDYHSKIIMDKQANIEASFERLVQKFDTVENLSYILAENDSLKQYSYACLNNSTHTVVECLEIKALLASMMTNPVVEDICLLDSKDNRVIATNCALSDLNMYFSYTYVIEEHTVEESIARFETYEYVQQYSPSVIVGTSSGKKEVVEYRVIMPLGWIRNSQTQLIFVLDTTELFENFSELIQEGGEIYLYDRDDVLIYKNGDQYEGILELSEITDLREVYKEEESVYGMVCQSSDNFWKIQVYVPELLEEDGLGGMVPYLLGLVALPVSVSMLFCIYFTHKNYKEIVGVLEVLKGHSGVHQKDDVQEEGTGYKIIQEYASKIVQENNHFKERLTDYENSHKYEVLDKLVRNAYESQNEMEHALTDVDLQIKEGKSVVLLIRYEDAAYRAFINENVSVKDFVKALVGELMERQYEFLDTSARESVCVMAIESDGNMDIMVRDIVSRLNVEISYYYGIEVIISVGGVAESVYQLGNSYMQAKEVIRYRETSGNKVIFYSELADLEDVYYYPRENDEKIYNYVVIGKLEEAKLLIQRIYEENFGSSSRKMSMRAIEMLRNRLWDCIVSIAEKYEISDTFTSKGAVLVTCLHSEKNIKEYFHILYEILDMLAAEIENKRQNVQNDSMSKILNFVKENCCDNTLSLNMLSHTFGFNESYISNLFKITYGENLSVYIERLRMEKACELIKNTDMKIANIAETIGYSSDSSFRRAFKKVIGVSPVEYRESVCAER